MRKRTLALLPVLGAAVFAVAGTFRSDCQTPPVVVPLPSCVNRSFFAHGSHVEPSIVGIGAPVESFVAITVTRWSVSASRLIRVR